MKKLYRFIYFISSALIYILLALFEFFYLNNLVDIISDRYFVHVIFLGVALVVINPLITFYLINLIPIRPKKKVKSISDELKREVK